MNISVKLFAAAHQLTGLRAVDVQVADDATIADLRRELIARYPALTPLADHLMFAVNQDYANDDVRIRDNAEVAAIPPVSGG